MKNKDEIFPAKRKVRINRRTKKSEDGPTDDEMKWLKYFHKLDPDEPSPMVIILWGKEGCGKTDLALRLADQAGNHVYLVETEGGHNVHTVDRIAEELSCTIHKCVVDTLDENANVTQKWFTGGGRAWETMEDVLDSLQHAPTGTVVIDSGSDLLPMLVSQFAIDWQRGDKAFPPQLYTQCYGRLRLVINKLRSVHHVIITAQEADKYDRRSDTPKVVGRKVGLWKTSRYLAEHTVEILNDEGTEERTYRVKHRKSRILNLKSLDWDELLSGFSDEKVKLSEKLDATARWEKGVRMLESLDVEWNDPIPGSTEDILSGIENMLDKYKATKAERDAARDAKRIRKPKPKQKESANGTTKKSSAS